MIAECKYGLKNIILDVWKQLFEFWNY